MKLSKVFEQKERKEQNANAYVINASVNSNANADVTNLSVNGR